MKRITLGTRNKFRNLKSVSLSILKIKLFFFFSFLLMTCFRFCFMPEPSMQPKLAFYVAQAGLELALVLLPPTPQCWDYTHVFSRVEEWGFFCFLRQGLTTQPETPYVDQASLKLTEIYLLLLPLVLRLKACTTTPVTSFSNLYLVLCIKVYGSDPESFRAQKILEIFILMFPLRNNPSALPFWTQKPSTPRQQMKKLEPESGTQSGLYS